MQAQTFGADNGMMAGAMEIFEINPRHPFTLKLLEGAPHLMRMKQPISNQMLPPTLPPIMPLLLTGSLQIAMVSSSIKY
eukprot:4938904-Ditylum_brightwellii.AAC.1